MITNTRKFNHIFINKKIENYKYLLHLLKKNNSFIFELFQILTLTLVHLNHNPNPKLESKLHPNQCLAKLNFDITLSPIPINDDMNDNTKNLSETFLPHSNT